MKNVSTRVKREKEKKKKEKVRCPRGVTLKRLGQVNVQIVVNRQAKRNCRSASFVIRSWKAVSIERNGFTDNPCALKVARFRLGTDG